MTNTAKDTTISTETKDENTSAVKAETAVTAEGQQTGTLEEQEEPAIVYPIVNETETPEYYMSTRQESADAPETWKKTWKDNSKTITLDASGYEITKYTKDGHVEFMTPRTKHKVEIFVGSAGDVLKARRMVGNKMDEEAFTQASIAQLTKFDGQFMPPEAIAKKGFLGYYEYITIMGVFQDINF